MGGWGTLLDMSPIHQSALLEVVQVELYGKWMELSRSGEKHVSHHFEVSVRVVETEAGLSGPPKYNRTLAVCTMYDKKFKLYLRITLVRTKSDTYRLVENLYPDHIQPHQGGYNPIVMLDTNSRIEAITRFESEFCGMYSYVETDVPVPA